MPYNPYVPDGVDPTAGESGGGLLGGFSGFSPLTNFGFGLLAQSGPSLTPQSPWAAIGRAGQFMTEAQQQALQNALIREKLSASASETKAKAALLAGIGSGAYTIPGVDKATATALLASGDESLLGKLIPQALSPEAQAMQALNFPIAQKAELDLQKEKQLQGIEKVTSNTTIKDALEAAAIYDRMDKGPVPPGSSAANTLKALSDPETGYLNISPEQVAKTLSSVVGKPITTEQAHAFQTDWNRLIKLSAKSITDQRTLMAQQGAVGGQNRQTDFGLSLLQQQNISPYITSDAARMLLRDIIQRQFDIGGVRGWTLPNEEAGREFVQKYGDLRPIDYAVTPGAPGAPVQSAGGGLVDRAAGLATGVAGRALGAMENYLTPPPQSGAPAAEAPPAVSPAPPAASIASPAAAQEQPAPPPAPKIRGVKTSDFGMDPYTNRPAPRYRSAAEADKAVVELKRKGIPRVIVVDPATGIEYLYEVQ